MNIKTILDRISDIVLYFKSMYYKYTLPTSKYKISDSSILTIQASKIVQYLSSVPKYSQIITKDKSIEASTQSNSVYIYPNNYMFSLRSGTSLDSSSIPYLLIDENNNRFDARTKGGGLKDRYIEENYLSDILISSHADIGRFDGMVNTASTSIIFRFPEDIKNKYSEDTIKEYLYKYIPAGLHPVILYYTHTGEIEDFDWKLKETKTS